MTERGLEDLIYSAMVWQADDGSPLTDKMLDRPAAYSAGWRLGVASDYDREYCVDVAQLGAFLMDTQPETDAALAMSLVHDDGDRNVRRNFLQRLKSEITRRGVVDALRKGVHHRQHKVELFYATPTPGNETAAKQYSRNRFSITRQLQYSRDNKLLALDLGCVVKLL